LITGLFGRGLIRSFSRLAERARAVAGGQLERRGAPEGAEQEVAELFESFDRMVDDLKAGQAEREHRYRDMAALHAIAAAITEPLNLSHLLSTTLDRTVEVMNADAGMIYLLNEATGVLEIAAHRGLSDAYVGWVDRIALGEGGVGRAAVKGEPEIFEDVRTDSRISRDVVRTEGIVSVLIVPVTSKRKIIGTLYVATRSPRSFTPHETQILTSISHQIGVAVENVRLYEAAQDQTRELAVLHEVGTTLTTTLDLTTVLEAIADSAVRLIDAQRCAVFELDPRDQRLYPRVIRGMPSDLVAPVKLGQGAAGAAASQRRPFFSQDIERYPPPMYDEPAEGAGMTLRELVLQRGCRAVLAVPLVSRETVFGTISIYWDHVHAGDERETRLLTALARQAAVAVENARLYESARDRIREMEAMLDVAGILGSTLELTPLLKRIAKRTAQLCRVERCTIELFGEDGRVIPMMSQFANGRVNRELWEKFRNAEPYRADGVPAYVRMIERKAPVIIPDATATDLIPRQWVEVFGLKSYLLVPLIRKERVIGALGLDHHTEVKGFTP
ncbi:MAG: GAF domain-containing protein, partial [Candidatus Rokubacteria bacterium]|nr:GAF domain-containing protein [Candidatus Rokubacteria bacterium]